MYSCTIANKPNQRSDFKEVTRSAKTSLNSFKLSPFWDYKLHLRFCLSFERTPLDMIPKIVLLNEWGFDS